MDGVSAVEVADPRPDLADGGLYARLLAAAHRLDGDDPAGCFGALHGLRCCGARLKLDFGRAVLVAGECEDYAELRARYLLPRADRVRALLAGVVVPQAGDIAQGSRA